MWFDVMYSGGMLRMQPRIRRGDKVNGKEEKKRKLDFYDNCKTIGTFSVMQQVNGGGRINLSLSE